MCLYSGCKWTSIVFVAQKKFYLFLIQFGFIFLSWKFSILCFADLSGLWCTACAVWQVPFWEIFPLTVAKEWLSFFRSAARGRVDVPFSQCEAAPERPATTTTPTNQALTFLFKNGDAAEMFNIYNRTQLGRLDFFVGLLPNFFFLFIVNLQLTATGLLSWITLLWLLISSSFILY